MSFPGAHDEVYYNEAGEPLGWDKPGDPEWCAHCGKHGHDELDCPYADFEDEYDDADEL
jgi:hypothetical protein